MEDNGVFTSSQIIEEVTEIEMDEIKGSIRSKKNDKGQQMYVRLGIGCDI
ncbi:hypothetical protein ES708_24054 [subsurface metagenome]